MPVVSGGKQKIGVHVRVRPYKRSDGPYHEDALVISGRTICASNSEDKGGGGRSYKYSFDQCHDSHATQADVFQDVEALVERVMKGNNATIFAYGVTGSGKTHTMQGTDEDPGIIPRAVKSIFARTEELEAAEPTVSFSFVEILKDEVFDLQSERRDRRKLSLRDAGKGNISIAELSTTTVASPEEFEDLYNEAAATRKTASTNLNSQSSRSHAILTIHVHLRWKDGSYQSSKICLTDLAGSENNNLTGNDRERMLESSAINKSLTTLGNVVDAINKNHIRIPYRDCKLTRILQDALGGSSAGLLICCLAPGSKFTKDTINTLNFANRTREVENSLTLSERNAITRRESTAATGSRTIGAAGSTRASIAASSFKPDANSTMIAPPSFGVRPVTARPSNVLRPLAVSSNIGRPSIAASAQGLKGTKGGSIQVKENSHAIDATFNKMGGLTRAEARLAFDQWYAEEERKRASTQSVPVGTGGKFIEDMTREERDAKKKHYVNAGRQYQLNNDIERAHANFEKALLYDPHNERLLQRVIALDNARNGLGPVPELSEGSKQRLSEGSATLATSAQVGMKRNRGALEVVYETETQTPDASQIFFSSGTHETDVPRAKRRTIGQPVRL